jgi:thiol:disulfide interchange protein
VGPPLISFPGRAVRNQEPHHEALRVFLVVSLAYAWYCFYVPANTIAWADNYASAQTLATDSGKPIILYFTGKWCVPCRVMQRQVWADASVGLRLEEGERLGRFQRF